MQPRNHLTPREVQVACLVWEGHTNRELALYIVSHGGSNWPEAAPVPAEPAERALAHAATSGRYRWRLTFSSGRTNFPDRMASGFGPLFHKPGTHNLLGISALWSSLNTCV